MDFQILDVLRFHRGSRKYETAKREFCVLSCRLHGSAAFHWEGGEATTSETEFLFIPPGIDYTQETRGEEVIAVHLDFNAPVPGTITSIPCPATLRQQFVALHNAWQEKSTGYELRCKGLVYEILYQLLTAFHRDARELAPAMEYIRAEFCNPAFSLDKAIQKTYLSPAYFRRLFKRSYGMSPVQYITALKLQYAKSLLESGSFTLSEIAEQCGFADEKYFYAVFKKETGTTPAKWRKG